MKKIIEKAVYLFLTAGVISIVVNTISPVGIEVIGQWDPSAGVVSAGAKNAVYTPGIEIDDIDAAGQIYDRAEAIFVDARAKNAYEEGHVKGAVSMPVEEFELIIETFLDRFPLDQPIIAYCSGRSCDDSHRLSQKLIDFGYKKVSVMIDGFPGWQEKGFPVE